MKQIVVISGKGGTGKTFLSGSLAVIAENSVIADCDVDASNLHFLLHPDIVERNRFIGGKEAIVDPNLCTGCFKCRDLCRFDAITEKDGKAVVDPILCEGCAVCSYACPEEAIVMQSKEAGEWYVSNSRYGNMVHARLKAGEENSGKLVSTVRQRAKTIAEEQGNKLVLIDGPPGTGCSVIATLSGVDLAIIVTEPTLSGIHDMDRVLDLCTYFSIRPGVVVNKYDVNRENSQKIKDYCKKNSIPYFGDIPYARSVVDSVSEETPYVLYAQDTVTDAIYAVWDRVLEIIDGE